MFGSTHYDVCLQLGELFSYKRQLPSTQLFAKGDPPSTAWLVVSGRVRITNGKPSEGENELSSDVHTVMVEGVDWVSWEGRGNVGNVG